MNILAQSQSNQLTGQPEVRLTQIEEQTSGLHVNAQDLEKMVEAIISKLTPVCNPLGVGGKANSTPQPVLVPLAMKLQEICTSIRNSVDRLRELNASIELP